MTFEGQYLTYIEYKSLIEGEGGSAMGEMPFNLLEFEARKQIDEATLFRLKNVENIPQEVKLCDYKLINSINAYITATKEMVNSGNVKSENTDGYSITYANASEIEQVLISKKDEIQSIISSYLFGVIVNGEHILYTGM